jgi:ABC-2 type transport system ATP-binding protein
MSIEVKKVSKYYGDQAALSEVSISIKKGEIVGFLGPNGAGKSTLMKIICCYLNQDKGDVIVCDKTTQNNEIEIKSKIGYLPEQNPLYEDMYIKEYLAFVAGVFNISKQAQAIDKMIEQTGLEKEQHKKIGQLSKGYRQRVGLAAALIHDPEVLILDEPTTGLDPNQLVEIRNLIKINGENKTVLLSTHIMQEVERICNRVIIINKGKIVSDRQMKELKAENINLEKYFQDLTQ